LLLISLILLFILKDTSLLSSFNTGLTSNSYFNEVNESVIIIYSEFDKLCV